MFAFSIQHLNSWIPYLNIALIFCVICMYGLGPCEFSVGCSSQRQNVSLISFIQFKLLYFLYLLLAGVSMALPADLFLQAWRPSAYVISGTINWLGMFLVGMLFGYIVVRYLLCIKQYILRLSHTQCWYRKGLALVLSTLSNVD